MALDLSKITERDKLKAQREPHWQRLRAGCFLGFRPSKRGGKGTWIARAYDEDSGKYRLKALGDFGGLTGNEVFTTAKREAEAFAELVEAGGQAQFLRYMTIWWAEALHWRRLPLLCGPWPL